MADNHGHYDLDTSQGSLWVDNLLQNDLDSLLGPEANPKSRAAICQSIGIDDNQLPAGSLNWSSVRPVFLDNAKRAYAARKPDGAAATDGAQYVKDAVLGSIKLVLCATPGSTAPTSPPVMAGYAWSSAETGDQSETADGYSYNSAGSTNSIEHLGTGSYTVTFQGLGEGSGGNVQVTAYGYSANRCKVAGWSTAGNNLLAGVNCFDASGSPVDTKFTASYLRRTSTASGSGAYVWADEPSSASYTPSTLYQWNSTGASNTIQRWGVGSYNVTLPGVDLNGGTAQVTAYGSSSEHCQVGGWGGDAVSVTCYDSAGQRADSLFSLNFANALSPNGSASYHYLWADQPSNTATYTPFNTYQKGFQSSECTPHSNDATIQRTNTGSYRVSIPHLSTRRSNVNVTAYGYGGETCKVAGWSGSNPVSVDVVCHNPQGPLVDSYFTLAYSSMDYLVC